MMLIGLGGLGFVGYRDARGLDRFRVDGPGDEFELY
jgi:hypothetical protein